MNPGIYFGEFSTDIASLGLLEIESRLLGRHIFDMMGMHRHGGLDNLLRNNKLGDVVIFALILSRSLERNCQEKTSRHCVKDHVAHDGLGNGTLKLFCSLLLRHLADVVDRKDLLLECG
jgi:hypothetical protein